jgi:hypothetical protein
MEAAGSSETLVTVSKTTWHHNPEGYILHFHRHENSYIIVCEHASDPSDSEFLGRLTDCQFFRDYSYVVRNTNVMLYESLFWNVSVCWLLQRQSGAFVTQDISQN